MNLPILLAVYSAMTRNIFHVNYTNVLFPVFSSIFYQIKNSKYCSRKLQKKMKTFSKLGTLGDNFGELAVFYEAKTLHNDD